jgi:drug/metabolite transporter (DMT)-like permease
LSPRAPHPGLGIGLILAMAACFAVLDTTVKFVGATLPVLIILWARYAFQAVTMGLWLGLTRRAPFRSVHPRFQIVRGLLLLLTSALSFAGLRHMPVAEFTAINLLAPVAVTLLAAVFLHEQVSRRRWVLVAGAFAGALIVIRPGSGVFGWAVLYPLACASAYASFQVLSSRMASLESPYTTHFLTGAIGLAVITPIVLASSIDWTALAASIDTRHALLLALIGATGTFGHLMLIVALGMAPASTLMPFSYTQIGFAAAIGWAVFGHWPDGWALVGMAIIAACGAGSAWLHLRASRRPAAALADAALE